MKHPVLPSQTSIQKETIWFLAAVGFISIGIGVSVVSSHTFNTFLSSLITKFTLAPLRPDWPRNFYATGIEILVVGFLLLVSAFLVIPRWQTVEKNFLRFTIMAIIVLWLPVVIFGRSTMIEGERFWSLGDDAFISMRYARNLAGGFGLVWNPGERVEGYTNFLWTLYMALLHLFHIPAAKIPLLLLLTNVVLAVATAFSLVRLVRLIGGTTPVLVATLASFVLSGDTLQYVCFGMETSLLSFAVITCLYRVFEESGRGSPRILTYFLIGSISLIRADAIILSTLLYAAAFFLSVGKRKKIFLYILISLTIPFLQEIFRIVYYNDILPNTAYLKTMNWPGKYRAGILYVTRFLFRYSIPLIAATIGAIIAKNRIQRPLWIGLAVYTGYVAYIGGDAFSHYRFFVPVLPIVMALAFLCIQELKLRSNRTTAIAMLFCLITTPLIVPGYAVSLLFPYEGDVGNIRMGLYLKNNTPQHSKIADFWAGATLYFAERYAIDLLGKSDRHIAHMQAVPNATLPGHNKFDFAYSLGVLKPDFVNAMFKLPANEEEMRKQSSGDLPFTGQLYFDPVFRKHCFAHPLQVDTWRTIFACSW